MSEHEVSSPDDWFETPFGYIARYGRHIHTVASATQEQQEELHRHLLNEVLPEIEAQRETRHEELLVILKSVDARELLMQLAIPYLHIDPNTWREWDSDNLPAHIEYLSVQVLGLSPSDAEGDDEAWTPEDLPRYSEALKRVESIVREVFELEVHRIQIKTHLEDASAHLTDLEREARSRAITEAVVVRHNAYALHVVEIARGLFKDLDGLLLAAAGFTIEDALSIYDTLGDLLYSRLYERREESHTYIQRTLKDVKRERQKPGRHPSDELVQRLAKLPPSEAKSQLHGLAAGWMFLGSRSHTRITAEAVSESSGVEIERCRAFLALFTATPDEYDERFHRFPAPTNPLLEKPLIKDGSGWLLPVPGALLMALVPRLEQALATDQGTWDTYTRHRGTYLEDQTATLISRALPGAQTHARKKWKGTETEGELDVVVSYDDVTLLVQCKSGRVTPPAWRGAIHRMRDDLAKLAGEAATQHTAFREALRSHSADELGVGELAQALAAPIVLEVVVTIDELLGFTAEAYKLIEFGTLASDRDVPWVIALPDLFVVADMLMGCEFVHFLTRRLRLNRLGRVFAHDELDWLGHYLSEGLFFDYMFSDADAPDFLRLLSYTDMFDSWYFAVEGVRTVPTEKPHRARHEEILRLLRQLESQQPRHFSMVGLLACDWSSDTEAQLADQMRFARIRASESGVGSVSGILPGYGFSWAANGRSPLAGVEMAKFLATKERRADESQPMWVSVVETPGFPLAVAVSPTGNRLREAIDKAVLEPALDLKTPATAPFRFAGEQT